MWISSMLEAVAGAPSLHGWQGLGLAVQAYQKRAFPLIDWLGDLAQRHQRRLMVRLVKGAYWDTEIKLTQERGLAGYPVFTRKVSTDVSYLACAKKLFAGAAHFYPQFATHNAHTLAAVLEMAGNTRDYEFQRLHGMELLEPLQESFGALAIRSAYRSPAVNDFGNKHGLNCARNEADRAGHIWDQRDRQGRLGATACIVVPWFADRYADGADWRALAWWIHDHLPYHHLQFFPKLAAFNITWREEPERIISSYIAPRGILTRPGVANHGGDHSKWYRGFPARRAG